MTFVITVNTTMKPHPGQQARVPDGTNSSTARITMPIAAVRSVRRKSVILAPPLVENFRPVTHRPGIDAAKRSQWCSQHALDGVHVGGVDRYQRPREFELAGLAVTVCQHVRDVRVALALQQRHHDLA